MVGESAQNFVHYYSIKPITSIWGLTPKYLLKCGVFLISYYKKWRKRNNNGGNTELWENKYPHS